MIDYRDAEVLKKFVSSQLKIVDPRHTNICAKHQRRLAKAIKQARVMGILPFVKK